MKPASWKATVAVRLCCMAQGAIWLAVIHDAITRPHSFSDGVVIGVALVAMAMISGVFVLMPLYDEGRPTAGAPD